MAKRKKNNNYYDEDHEEIRGKGDKREKKKARRHNDKLHLRDIKYDDYNELDDYMDDLDWRSHK